MTFGLKNTSHFWRSLEDVSSSNRSVKSWSTLKKEDWPTRENTFKFQAILDISFQTYQSFCIQVSWEGGEDINSSGCVINELLTVLKGLSHLLENQGLVCGMVEQRHGFLASIPIKLPFNINSPLEVWASWRKVNGAIWWRCRPSTNLPLDCFQTPRNVSCVACGIIEVFLKFKKNEIPCHTRLCVTTCKYDLKMSCKQ